MCSLVNARQCLAIRCSIPTTNHLCLALGHIYMLLKTFAQLPSAAGGQKTKKKNKIIRGHENEKKLFYFALTQVIENS